MRIGLEIDNLISSPATSLTDFEAIAKVTPIDGAKEVMDGIREQGHQIVLFTSRDMSTALETERWLDKNKIPYDMIIYNRPRMNICYSTDFKEFNGWEKTKEELVQRGFLQEKKDENSGRSISGGTEKNIEERHKDSKDVDEESGGASSSEQKAERPGFQVLKPRKLEESSGEGDGR